MKIEIKHWKPIPEGTFAPQWFESVDARLQWEGYGVAGDAFGDVEQCKDDPTMCVAELYFSGPRVVLGHWPMAQWEDAQRAVQVEVDKAILDWAKKEMEKTNET